MGEAGGALCGLGEARWNLIDDRNDESKEKENFCEIILKPCAKAQEKERDGVIDSCQTSEDDVLDVFAKRRSWACRQMDVQKNGGKAMIRR